MAPVMLETATENGAGAFLALALNKSFQKPKHTRMQANANMI